MERMMEQMRTVWDRNGAARLVEADGEYVFVMDLPGYEREETSLTFDEGAFALAVNRPEIFSLPNR